MKEIERAIEQLNRSIEEIQMHLFECDSRNQKETVYYRLQQDKIQDYLLARNCLQSELDRQENKALTLSELKEMRHYPVWVKIGSNEPFCMILSNIDKYYVRGALPNIKQNSIKFMVDNDLPNFYKHKPNGGE